MKRRPGLTLAQHVDVGRRMSALRAEAFELLDVIQKGYGVSHPAVKWLYKVSSRIVSLEEEMFKEHGLDRAGVARDGTKVVNPLAVYYGAPGAARLETPTQES